MPAIPSGPPGSADLPCDDFIHEHLLFLAGTGEINAGGFHAFMAEEIGQKRNVAAAVEKVFCESVTERMRIYS